MYVNTKAQESSFKHNSISDVLSVGLPQQNASIYGALSKLNVFAWFRKFGCLEGAYRYPCFCKKRQGRGTEKENDWEEEKKRKRKGKGKEGKRKRIGKMNEKGLVKVSL